ncbi:MAG: response regulator [Candidatus Chisholmbacteria bacterium]|nr:response regulator [Candidatus Chisholmbacteria bacterium]
MNGREIKLAIFDDVPSMRDTVRLWLEDDNDIHSVAEAGTREDALAIVPRLGEMGVSAVTLDGNFSKDDYSGNDGREVLAAIRKMYGDQIVVAAISAGDFTQKGEYRADVFFNKDNYRRGNEVPLRIRQLVESRGKG